MRVAERGTDLVLVMVVIAASGCPPAPDTQDPEFGPRIVCALGELECCVRTKNHGSQRGERDCFELDTEEYSAYCLLESFPQLGTCVLLCNSDGDCDGLDPLHQPIDCREQDCGCDEGFCVPIPCMNDEACPQEEVCIAGDCIMADEKPDACVIAPSLVHVRPEEVFVVEASVQRGGQALRTVEPFVWHSADPAIAAVQGTGPVARITGGVTGQTQVRVTIGEAECSVSVINYGRPAEDEVRLVILHSTDRRGIQGARVLLADGEEVAAETTSGPDGVARLPRPGTARFDVHVLAPTEAGSLLPEAKHLSILENEEMDLLLVLPPAPAKQRVAFTGEVDVQDLRASAVDGAGWVVYMPGDRNDPVILPAIGDRMCGDDTCLDPVGEDAAWRAELLHTTHSLSNLVRFDDADLGRLFRRLRGFSSLLLQEE